MMIKHLNRSGGDEPGFEVGGEVLLLINNCLNEVLHGFRTPALDDKLEISVEAAENLLDRVNRTADLENPVVLSASELAAIAKCIHLTVFELDLEFSIRTGFQIESANSYAKEISEAITGNRTQP